MSAPDLPPWSWPVLAMVVMAAAATAVFVRTRRARRVFISYRRVDTRDVVVRLHEGLRRWFGKSVFLDERSIGEGEPFPLAIARRLQTSDVVLVAVGPTWLTARNHRGLRLEQPDDIVRNEITLALGSGALVIPLLIDGASMPRADELPEPVRPLVERNAVVLTADLDQAIDRLARAVLAAPVQRTPWMVLLAHLAIMAVVALYALSGGFLGAEVWSVLSLVTPLFVATAAVAVLRAVGAGRRRARSGHVPVSTLWLPIGLAAAAAALVAMKASNFLIDTFPAFQTALFVVEGLLAIHTGVVLTSLFENGGVP